MNKQTPHSIYENWPKYEAFLIGLCLPAGTSCGKVARLLVQQFGGSRQYLRKHDLVKQFVKTLQGADGTYVEDAADSLVEDTPKPKGRFEKIPHVGTEFEETASGAKFRATFVVDAGTSIDDYIAENVDLEKYEVVKTGKKVFQGFMKDEAEMKPVIVTMCSIFVDLKPKQANTAETGIKSLLEEFKSYVQPVPRFTYQKKEQCAAIINLFDAHLEKVCLVTETGYGSTVEDNEQEYERLFDTLLAHAVAYSPEVIIFPIGNDFFNVNGPGNSTKKGTPQAMSMKSHDAFVIGFKLLRRTVDKAKQVAKVKIKIIKGNHDEDLDFYLGQVLAAVYESDPNVEIDTERKQRKYEQYGVNLFGFAHGDKEARKVSQLPLLMAEEQKQAWADTSYRTFFLGDKHHTMEYQFLRSKDFIGCLVKFLRSVGTTDEWHYDNGYIGIPRTGEVEIHAKNGGMIGHHFAHAQYRNQVA